MRFSILSVLAAVLVCNAQQDQVPLGTAPTSEFKLPLLGFGTWNLEKSNASDVVSTAIQIGYRHIDCASAYGNEKEVGMGINDGLKKTGLAREDLWITSKLWINSHSPDDVPKALDNTLSDLGLDYLDLYLMHWPVALQKSKYSIDYLDTWKALTQLQATSPTTLHHIGISNFSPRQLHQLLISYPDSTPHTHQFELHPYLQQPQWVSHHRKHGIHVTAYSPLGNSNPVYDSTRKDQTAKAIPPLLENPILAKIASRRECASTAQVALAWGMLRGTSVIPKSAHENRMLENYDTVGKCRLLRDDEQEIERDLAGKWSKRLNNPSSSWGVKLFEGLQDVPDYEADGASSLGGMSTEPWESKFETADSDMVFDQESPFAGMAEEFPSATTQILTSLSQAWRPILAWLYQGVTESNELLEELAAQKRKSGEKKTWRQWWDEGMARVQMARVRAHRVIV